MQILIDIPEDFYEALKKTDEMSSGLRSEKTLMSVVYSAVAKGTPFPEEPVLDKIRAEMADLASRTMNDNRASGMWTCIDILDKYKRERKERGNMAEENNEPIKKEEKTGHWMHWIYSSDYVNDTAYKCSECGFEQKKSEKLSRCPKCKSKMQEYGD